MDYMDLEHNKIWESGKKDYRLDIMKFSRTINSREENPLWYPQDIPFLEEFFVIANQVLVEDV